MTDNTLGGALESFSFGMSILTIELRCRPVNTATVSCQDKRISTCSREILHCYLTLSGNSVVTVHYLIFDLADSKKLLTIFSNLPNQRLSSVSV